MPDTAQRSFPSPRGDEGLSSSGPPSGTPSSLDPSDDEGGSIAEREVASSIETIATGSHEVPGALVAGSSPDLSVVVPSVNGWGDLEGCLAALQAQTGGLHVEIVVADRVGDRVREPLRSAFPDVRLLPAARGTSIPALRALAFDQVRADVVAVIEDHVIVPPDWGIRMLRAHQDGHEVVGGGVENAASQRLVDWAAFLCEYSHCLAPPSGPATWVTGNNVTYRRHLLERFRDVIGEGRWEDRLHDALRVAGVPLLSRPEIRVGHKKHYTVAEYIHQRYLYSRSFAGRRMEGAGPLRRIAYGIGAFALPPLLLYRVSSRVILAGDHTRRLLYSLPLMVPFVFAWAVGEAIGYWFGPGDSLSKVS